MKWHGALYAEQIYPTAFRPRGSQARGRSTKVTLLRNGPDQTIYYL